MFCCCITTYEGFGQALVYLAKTHEVGNGAHRPTLWNVIDNWSSYPMQCAKLHDQLFSMLLTSGW